MFLLYIINDKKTLVILLFWRNNEELSFTQRFSFNFKAIIIFLINSLEIESQINITLSPFENDIVYLLNKISCFALSV